MIWTAAGLAETLGTAAPAGAVEFTGVSTDSRTIGEGELFVALVGERFDGHDYLKTARDRGALGAVVRHGTPPTDGLPCFAVPDTLRALGALGRARRDHLPSDAPVVAITGSSGKTTVKEMVAAVLGARYRVHVTRLNENNLVGVPLTLLAIPDDAEAVVVEVGANAPGEIARLRDVVRPTIAVVTNVGPAHLEGLGTVDDVLREKVALVEGADLAVVGTRPPALAREAALRARTLVAGLGVDADVRAERWTLRSDGYPVFTYRGREVTLPVVGIHQVDNALLALAVAGASGVAEDPARRALTQVEIPRGRMEVIERGGLTIIQDCYNANPDSLRAALQTFEVMKGERRSVVVVGSMLELGDASERLHGDLAREVALTRPTIVGAVGAFVPAFEALGDELASTLVTAADPADLGATLRPLLVGNEIVLLKASRGVALERALDALTP